MTSDQARLPSPFTLGFFSSSPIIVLLQDTSIIISLLCTKNVAGKNISMKNEISHAQTKTPLSSPPSASCCLQAASHCLPAISLLKAAGGMRGRRGPSRYRGLLPGPRLFGAPASLAPCTGHCRVGGGGHGPICRPDKGQGTAAHARPPRRRPGEGRKVEGRVQRASFSKAHHFPPQYMHLQHGSIQSCIYIKYV